MYELYKRLPTQNVPLIISLIWASSGSQVSMVVRISVTTSPAQRSKPEVSQAYFIGAIVATPTRARPI